MSQSNRFVISMAIWVRFNIGRFNLVLEIRNSVNICLLVITMKDVRLICYSVENLWKIKKRKADDFHECFPFKIQKIFRLTYQ